MSMIPQPGKNRFIVKTTPIKYGLTDEGDEPAIVIAWMDTFDTVTITYAQMRNLCKLLEMHYPDKTGGA